MGVMALWKRMASDGLMSIAAVVTVAMSLLLLATGPIYADAVSLAALRATLREAPAAETTIAVSIHTAPGAYPVLDGLVSDAVDGATAGVDTSTRRSLASGSYRIPSVTPTAQLTDIVVLVSVDELADHATLVAGDWPTAPGGTRAPDGATIGVAVDERIGVALGITAGDRVDIEPTGQDREPLAAHVTGLYQVAEPSDGYWTGLDDLLAGGRVSSQFRTHPFVTTADALRSPQIGRLDADWLVDPDVDAIGLDQVDELRRGAATLEGRLISAAGRAIDDPAAISEFEVTTELTRLLAGTERSVTVTRSSVFGVVFQIALLAGYALMLTAAIAVETRGRESRLLRSRGARPRDLAAIAALEAAFVAVPLALAAPFLAAQALRLADDIGPLASIGLDLDPSPTSMSYLMAVIGAVAVVVVLVAPVVRGARRAERTIGTPRESATSRSQRAGVDLALLALAVVAFWQLATLGDDRAASVRGRFGVDPLLILAPALGLVAAAVVALRLVPLSARAGEVTATRSRRAVPALVGWQVARRPSRSSRTALLLIAAVAVGALATTFTTTWRASQEAQADQDVGADARVQPNRRTGDSIGDLHLTAAYESVGGVGRAMAVTRAPIELPGTESTGEFIGVGADRAPTVIRSHDAATSTAIDLAMAELARHRPTVAGFELPGAPHAITATLDVVEDEVVLDDAPIEPELAPAVELILLDGAGLLHRVDLGRVTPGDGPSAAIADLASIEGVTPLPPLSLVAIEATWVTPAIIARDARISVSALAAVDADGAELPLDGLDGRSWAAKPTPLGFLSQRPTAVAAPTPDGLRLSVGSGFDGQPVAVIVSARPAGFDSVTLMPVAVTERYLDETGGELGDRIRLDGLAGGVAAVEIVATVPSFPTVDPRRTEPIIADLTTVQLAALAPGQSIRPPDEYWLELDVDDHAAVRPVLEAAPFEVVTLVTRDEQLDALTSDPPAVAALGAMSVGFVAATLFAAVGFAVSASISARERADEFATLRALGLSQRQLGRWLAAEQVIVATMSLVVGLAIGLALSTLLLPRISLTQRGEEVFPPVEIAYPWSSIGVLLVIVAAVTAVVVAAVFAQVARLDRGRSRIGEVE